MRILSTTDSNDTARFVVFGIGPLLLIFIAFEVYLRFFPGSCFPWIPRTLEGLSAQNTPTDIVFFGSSRVRAAVSTEEIAEVGAQNGRSLRGLNLGAGYTTIAERFFAAKRLAHALQSKYADHKIIFAHEAPMDFPPIGGLSDGWVNDDNPYLVKSLLELRDTLQFLSLSSNTIDTKLRVLATQLIGSFAFFVRQQDQLERRLETLRDGRSEVDPSVNRFQLAPALSSVIKPGETFTDRYYFACEFASWARQNGNQLFFFTMPMHSTQSAEYLTSMSQSQKPALHKFLTACGARFIELDFPVTDQDFPDGWHLDLKRQRDYSKALGERLSLASSLIQK